METADKIEKLKIELIAKAVRATDKQIEELVAFLETREGGGVNELLEIDKTLKVIEKLPTVMKARNLMAAIANGDVDIDDIGAKQTKSNSVEKKNQSALQRFHNE